MKMKLFLAACCILFFNLAYADDMNSAVGKWITFDDNTHEPSGLVQIYENNGKLSGKIIKGYGHADNVEYCHNCPGDLNNKPVLDLIFLWDFVPQNDGIWSHGKIIDPHDGKIYKGSMKLIDGGKKLALRGYWGIFWRTKVWNRSTQGN